MGRGTNSARSVARVGYAVAAVLAALYFFQSSTLAPNHTDEGLLLQYVDDMAHGERPFYDFVDAYGLLNWVFPVAFYKAFGNQVWGVRIWLVLLKVITLGTAFVLVKTLSRTPRADGSSPDEPAALRGGTFYGVIASLFTMVLLGAQWQSLETPYAFVTVMPLTLGAWYFLLCAPLRAPRANVVVAAVLTASAIWTKLNTGMYLLAGGLFTYFFFIPLSFEEAGEETEQLLTPQTFARIRWVGALSYGLLFGLSIRRYFNVWFLLYLLIPLIVGVTWTVLITVRRAPANDAPSRYLKPWVTYFVTSTLLSVVVLVGYYGPHMAEYVTELSGILSHIRYTAPFPPLGERGHYTGLNEYGWLQLPLVLTALFVVWIAFAERRGPSALGAEWSRRRAQVSALFVLITLHTFVMYARCDETHIYQALVLAVPVLFVVLAQLDGFLHAWKPSTRFPLRLAIAGFGTYYMLSLAVTPSVSAFQIARSDWQSPRLEHLRYREKFSPYVSPASPNVFDYDWDHAMDETAEYIRSVTVPREEILLLTPDRILHLASNTRGVGGRYHFFFYLASVGLLDREGFDALVPKDVVADVVNRPPRVLISALGSTPLEIVFPEFQWLRDNMYVQTRHFRHILVYELRIDGRPVSAPLR